MKCTIPEISWHNRDPVLSVDIKVCLENDNVYHLATGGTDTHVVIWELNILENGGVSVEMLSDLTRHNRAINAVRFSPNGKILASSDDEAAIILWKKNEDANNDIFMDESEKDNKEHWNVLKMLRGHIEDVYDLSWSSCSQFIISGSVDNSAILWDVQKGKSISILNDHKGFVQGVAWDPKGQMVATLSSDRHLRIYSLTTKKVIHRNYKATLPSLNPGEEPQKSTRLFYDDTLKSFCRRLSFSPDGELLLAPSGILENGDGKQTNVTHVFLRSCLNRPVMCFPTNDKYTIAVRFCPQIFELKRIKTADDDDPSYTELFNLPYRMVFAVATQNAVLIYDTQQPIPFAKVSNIHYTRLSDISWSSNGKILIVSSTDGYCSLVSFADGELGTPYTPPDASESGSPPPKHTSSPSETKNSPSGAKNSLPSTPAGQKEVKEPMEVSSPLAEDKAEVGRKVPKAGEVKVKVAMPIQVKRKPGKRVELTTLSTNVEGKMELISASVTNESDVKKAEEKDSPLKVKPSEGNESEKESVPCSQSDVPLSKQSSTSAGCVEAPVPAAPKTPRRVPLITLSSPKSNKTRNS